jgi:regulator of replication initiation timing
MTKPYTPKQEMKSVLQGLLAINSELRAENARLREALTNARAETFDAIVHQGIAMENLLKNINAALEVKP